MKKKKKKPIKNKYELKGAVENTNKINNQLSPVPLVFAFQ